MAADPSCPLLSDRQHDAFANPAKMACRDGNIRVLGEAAYGWADRIGTIDERKEPSSYVYHHYRHRDQRRRGS